MVCLTLYALLFWACGTETEAPALLQFDIVRAVEDASADPDIIITENENSLSVDGAQNDRVTVFYEISNAQPNQLYSVQLEVTAQEEPAGQQAEIDLQNTKDINSPYISAGIEKAGGTSFMKKQVLKSDDSGQFALKVTYGISGNVVLPDPILKEIENDHDYYVCKEAENMTIVLLEEDRKENGIRKDEIQNLCRELSDFRNSIQWLCSGYEPYNGVTEILFTEKNQYTALAGNPIYINRDDMDLFFQEKSDLAIQKTDGTAILCHEISHTFDMDAYCFDKEFFASLKQFYALSDNGYDISYDFFMDSPAVSSGIYNYEAVLRQILENLHLLDGDWTIIKNALHALQELESAGLSKQELFEAFITELSSQSSCGIFTEEESAILSEYFYNSQ